MPKVPSKKVILALLAIIVVALTLFGTLDDLPSWLRGGFQAIGTLAGVWLGALLQWKDDGQGIEGAGKSALANLAALAQGIQVLLLSASNHRVSISNIPPKSIDSYARSTEAVLNGIEAQSESLLAQTRAAAEAWLPYVPEADEYLNKLAGGTK